MCGRYSLYLTYRDLLEIFGLEEDGSFGPRFNIAPSQDIPAIRRDGQERRLALLHWGLIPSWARDAKIAYRTINARAETAHKMPSFRAAFRQRRCLIPASGFFEWKREGKTKQPFHIRRRDGQPMAFAGLWEQWGDPKDEAVIESCSILTTRANREVSRIHDRMPVILEPGDFDLWLDPQEHLVEKLQTLLRPAADGRLILEPVSSYVNNPRNEGEKCLEPAPDES